MAFGTNATERMRQARLAAYAGITEMGWPFKVLVAIGFAGFIALAAQVSFPLPFTPVPFSLQVLAVTVTGAYLGRHYALLSVAIYIAAGAVGLKVFADQTSSGIDILTGFTAGYIVGFAAAAWFVGWYVERRRARLLDRRTATILAIILGVAALSSFIAIVWVSLRPSVFEAAWSDHFGGALSAARYLVWVTAGLIALGAVVALLLVKRARGNGWEKLNLFLVVMAAILLIHICGVAVLKPVLGYSWPKAVALGSLVFLPMDMVKAGLAVAVSTVFLPPREEAAKESA